MTDIVLYKLPEAFGLPSVSPYCLKVEAWLQIQDLPYRAEQGDLRKPPNKKLPWVSIDSQPVHDTHAILPALAEATGKGMAAPTGDDQWRAHAAMRIAEESVYWALVYARWTLDDGWAHLEPLVRALLPAPLRPLITPIIRKKTKEAVWAQGTGRMGPEFVWEQARADFSALDGLLGDRPYFGGAAICDSDVAVWAPLASIHLGPPEGPLRDGLRAYPRLVAWIEKVDALRA